LFVVIFQSNGISSLVHPRPVPLLVSYEKCPAGTREDGVLW
jgi:hypothetical protein